MAYTSGHRTLQTSCGKAEDIVDKERIAIRHQVIHVAIAVVLGNESSRKLPWAQAPGLVHQANEGNFRSFSSAICFLLRSPSPFYFDQTDLCCMADIFQLPASRASGRSFHNCGISSAPTFRSVRSFIPSSVRSSLFSLSLSVHSSINPYQSPCN